MVIDKAYSPILTQLEKSLDFFLSKKKVFGLSFEVSFIPKPISILN